MTKKEKFFTVFGQEGIGEKGGGNEKKQATPKTNKTTGLQCVAHKAGATLKSIKNTHSTSAKEGTR